jgi:hypothetical protein
MNALFCLHSHKTMIEYKHNEAQHLRYVNVYTSNSSSH